MAAAASTTSRPRGRALFGRLLRPAHHATTTSRPRGRALFGRLLTGLLLAGGLGLAGGVVRATPVAPALAAEPVAPAVEPATAPVRPAPAVTTTTLAAPPATITTLAAPAVTTTTLAPPPIATHSALVADVPADPPPRRPVSVAIEELGVVAPVVATGVDPETGQLAIPGDAGTVVWYEHGAAPGAEGSAVLAGHVDFNGHRGVFFDLAGVEVGSIVSVTHDDGTSTSFQVVDRQSHPKPDLPTSELFRRQGDPTLVLITCGGEFDRAARSYRSNVVVTAVPLR